MIIALRRVMSFAIIAQSMIDRTSDDGFAIVAQPLVA